MALNKLAKHIGGILGGVFLAALPAWASYSVDLYVNGGSGYSSTGGNTQIAQSFTPNASNINRIGVIGGLGSSYHIYGTFYICKGSPDPAQYSNLITILPCSGTGNLAIASTSLVDVYGTNGNVFNDYDIPITHLENGSAYYWQFISTSTILNGQFVAVTGCLGSGCGGQAYSYNSGNSATVDFFFHTYYDPTVTGDAIITVTSPVNNFVQANDNSINFTGYVTGADSLVIQYGPPNSSPAENLTAVNIANYRYDWSFRSQIPNGNWWVWYVATKGTSTVTATTSLTVSQQSVPNGADIAAATSTISTTTAISLLASTSVSCSTSVPAFIEDPASLWADNAPAFLSYSAADGTSTATNTPVFYSFVTGGIYSLVKTPTDMANKLSCYLSTAMAGSKGQAAGTVVRWWIDLANGVNALFPLPIATVIGFWAIGMALWFGRKLLPWFK